MFKSITFLGAVCAVLLVCKIGNVGTLGNLSWWEVFYPLLLEALLRIIDVALKYSGVYDKILWKWQQFVMDREIARKGRKLKAYLNKKK